jgi:superkiller protein 3
MAGPAERHAAQDLYKRALKEDDVRAIHTLLRARALAPRDERITYRIGFLFHKMNRRPEASEAYQATLDLKPCHTRALNNLGNIQKDQGDRAAALASYRRAIRCDREFSVAHYNLANLLRDAGELPEAVQHYEAALSSEPDHYRSHHNLGLIYLKMVRYRKGKTPETPNAGASLDLKRLSGKALQHLARACELNPRDPLNFYNRGRLYELHEDRAHAVSDYKRALSLLRRHSAFKSDLRKRIQSLEAPAHDR